MWPFTKYRQVRPIRIDRQPKTVAVMGSGIDTKFLPVIESQSDFGIVHYWKNLDNGYVILKANGKTNISGTWIPVSGWTNEELVKAGFADNVPQTVENMLAIAVLKGDKGAALALADRVIGGEIEWKEEVK